ncbi:MAG: hypothetical protein ISS48_00420 [Candidatus Aenigmarchaeota archaeon]|nr:hypothetical protein [Candidatus Aenigmarchaeota archaeon]
MNEKCNCWLKGMIDGDGYTDERHVEIYNSSESILKHVVISLKKLVSESRIKIDIYAEIPQKHLISKWSKILNIPHENFKIRKNTSPWKPRTEKIRIRVSSKELVTILNREQVHPKQYLSGLFDAEASVDIKGYIEFKQLAKKKGKNLVNDVFGMLNEMKIKTTEPRIKNDRNIKKDIYIYVKDLKKFQKDIGFSDISKKIKLTNIIRIKSVNKTPNISDIKRLLDNDKTLWEIMSELNSPYHKIRYLLKNNHLTVRYTR